MLHDQLPTLRRIVDANGGREAVDVVYHVWHNSSAPCEVASLAELEGFAAVVTTEPWACMWSVARGGDRGGARRAYPFALMQLPPRSTSVSAGCNLIDSASISTSLCGSPLGARPSAGNGK